MSYIILPKLIDHESAVETAEKMMTAEKFANLWCEGDGGSFDDTMRLVYWINQKAFTGIVLGNATSGSSVLFAACPRRLIGKHASIGVHTGVVYLEGYLDAAQFLEQAKRIKRCDVIQAQIYASASTMDARWWYNRMGEANGNTVYLFAPELVEIGFAEYI